MSAKRDKSQGFAFVCPDDPKRAYSFGKSIAQDKYDDDMESIGVVEGASLQMHQDIEALLSDARKLLNESDEAYSSILDFIIEDATKLRKGN